MFDKDFYPTPNNVIESMRQLVDWSSVTSILEPSAGKGDIVDHLNNYFSSRKVIKWDVIEKNEELRGILFSKNYNLVGSDFLQYETASEYDLIIANPPFSEGEKHLMKMIALAENQVYKDCQIVCLLNSETLNNTYSNHRKSLRHLLDQHNAEIKPLGQVFTSAERKTAVNVSMVYLKVKRNGITRDFIKEAISKCSFEKAGQYDLVLPANELDYSLDEIHRLVVTYQEHVLRFKAYFKALKDYEVYYRYLSDEEKLSVHGNIGRERLDFDEELKNIRYKYWNKILKTSEFRKVLTEDSYRKLIAKISELSSLEITVENVYTMLLSLCQNRTDMLTETLEGLFDEITKSHMASFSKNIHYYNGWKTNDAFKLNKKVIIPKPYSQFDTYYSAETFEKLSFDVKEKINDVLKVLSLVSATPTGEWETLEYNHFENNIIRVKVFQKGTIHIWFKDLSALDRLNFIVGQAKNWLPTDDEIKADESAADYVKSIFPKLDMKLLAAG